MFLLLCILGLSFFSNLYAALDKNTSRVRSCSTSSITSLESQLSQDSLHRLSRKSLGSTCKDLHNLMKSSEVVCSVLVVYSDQETLRGKALAKFHTALQRKIRVFDRFYPQRKRDFISFVQDLKDDITCYCQESKKHYERMPISIENPDIYIPYQIEDLHELCNAYVPEIKDEIK